MFALILAVLGTVLACIPFVMIIGWILLPIAFILAIVALVQKNTKKGPAIAGLIISIVGTIIGVAVFIYTLATAVDEHITTESTLSSAAPFADSSLMNQAPAGDVGDTRANPAPLGTVISAEDWSITINSVDLDATAAVLAENPFNGEPGADNTYILVNATITYLGKDPQGSIFFGSVKYVTANGTTINSTDNFAVGPDSLDLFSTMYEGGSLTGNIVLAVPAATAAEGVLAVSPDMFANDTFVAVQ